MLAIYVVDLSSNSILHVLDFSEQVLIFANFDRSNWPAQHLLISYPHAVQYMTLSDRPPA